MQNRTGLQPLGALTVEDGILFRIWAPKASRVDLVLYPSETTLPLEPTGDGYYERFERGVSAGSLYRYLLSGEHLFPDPASRFQPQGVHGPSMVVDPFRYQWGDGDWEGIPQKDLIFYELHTGTFSLEGSYKGIRNKLAYLKDLGINAIELMPVADFPGRWNWGYDPAALYAPSRAYGTPDDLRALIDEAHQVGIAFFLDVIYNHLGPDGAYVAAFAPMFTGKHHTPWGGAINLDDEGSTGVRNVFIDNAIYWLEEFHFDGLRLDATHALVDDSKVHFLAELTEKAAQNVSGWRRYLIAEDQRNINTMILPREEGGYGLDGIWTDDLHHQVRNITAGDDDGYYASFAGTTAPDIAKTIRQGWFFDGFYDPATEKVRGTDASVISPWQCVVYIQNHDQVGNRPQGNRLTSDISFPLYRAVSAMLLMVPECPLLFMGQEWASTSPFQFFTDHNEELGKLVSKGRIEEFGHFASFKGEVPDPQDPETFYRSRLDWDELDLPVHTTTLNLYRDLLHLRKNLPEDIYTDIHNLTALTVRRGPYALIVNMGIKTTLPYPENAELVLHTEEEKYAVDGHAPKIEGEKIHFSTSGAVLVKIL